jgi:hypothetical protein
MPLNRNAGRHAFGFTDDVCEKCGMTRPHFEDHRQPPCPGRKPDTRHSIVIQDDGDNESSE